MAGTGKKGWTGVTSDGKVVSGGIVQNGGASSGPGPGASAAKANTRVSSETYSNGQPKYVYTSSGKAVPTYGHRVVQGGKDGNLYDINNGVISNINGGGSYRVNGSSGGSDSYSPTYSDDDDDDYSYGGGSRGGGRSYNVVDPETQALKNKLTELEANKPAAYKNQYEGQIQNVLDTIMNRKAFDIKTDNNYQQLYDLYQQQYQAQASRGMRDAMGQLAGMTGGYGNTYAQTVGQQQYDQTMQGMNDNNINLMNLAYGIYADDRANDFNKMSTLRGLEGDDYSKYRDTMSDYYTDLNHFTNRYNTAWGNDYQLNRDAINDARYEDELAYAREQDAINRALAEEERDYERAWSEDDRDWSRKNSTAQQALNLVKAGYDPSGYLDSSGYGDSAGWLRNLYNQTQVSMAPEYSTGSRPGSSNKNPGRYDNSSSLTWQDVEALRQDKNTSSKTTSAAYSLLSDAEKAKYLANHKSR